MISNSTLVAGHLPPPAYTIPEETELTPGAKTPTSAHLPSNPAEIRARLHALREKENARDAGLDLVDLRQLMRAALQTSNDVQMIEVLQVGREEMPEAIKTLQRALEREVEKEGISASGSSGSSRLVGGSVLTVSPGVVGASSGGLANKGAGKEVLDGRRASMPVVVGGAVHGLSGLERRKTVASTADSRESGTGTAESLDASRSGSGSGTGSEGRVRDTLDREFIESGIDALRRVSNGPDMSLPSWTITK